VIEDACAFAWAQFLEHQPDRERNWRGWMLTTATRQAWKLERAIRHTAGLEPMALDEAEAEAVVAPLDEIELRNDINDALSLIGRLPLRLQRIALLRALGCSYDEIGQLTGDSKARAHALSTRANERIAEYLVERAHSVERWSPRAERLWQLEQSPPGWLVERIGRPTLARHRTPSPSTRRLAWRRAAIALDDLRTVAGPARFAAISQEPPAEPELRRLHAVATRAVATLESERGCQRER
jgi:DNA-directed RNA polymerase specialized sigma24 family protein